MTYVSPTEDTSFHPAYHPLSSGLDEQLLVEEEGISAGVEQYRRQTLSLEQKGLTSVTNAGHTLLSHWVRPLVTEIETFMAEAKTKPGRRHISIGLLEKVDIDVAALITCRSLIDSLTSQVSLQYVAVDIGNRIEEEYRFTQFWKIRKPLFKAVEKNLDNHFNGHNAETRRSMYLHTMKKFDVQVERWGKTDRMHLGLKLVDIALEKLGLFSLQRQVVKRKTKLVVVSSPLLQKWMAEYKQRSELFYPFRLPMVCPPAEWQGIKGGGYYNVRLKAPLVKIRTKGMKTEMETHEMPEVYSAVNTLQRTAWKINVRLLEAFNLCWRNGMKFKGIPAMYTEPMPAKPADIDTNQDARDAWKMMAADVYRNNEKNESKRAQIAQIRAVAERFSKYPAIWFPVQLDFRGRMYSQAKLLNPQGCDLAKGLLTFAEGKPLGNDGSWWLAIHIANLFGFDKVGMDERVSWTQQHTPEILACAADPTSNLLWTEADKPLQFLAACFEWEGFQKQGVEYVCSLPVLVDGSCNGIQHFSAMLRDEIAGRHVNLIPSEKPSDIYEAVAQAVVAFLRTYGDDTVTISDEREIERRLWAKLWIEYGIDRKIAKRPVMVLPYGGTMQAVREYITEAVREAISDPQNPKPNLFGKRLRLAVAFLSQVFWQVMGEVIVGPRLAMDWIRAATKLVAAEGLPINWTTPTGMLVQQRYLDMKPRRVETRVGDMRVDLTLVEETAKLDGRKQVTAASPNFVHSLDASALVRCINQSSEQGITSFAAIHDSYGTLAADMQVLQACLRESFVDLYEHNDVLQNLANELSPLLPEGTALPPLPARGSLDIQGVLSSEFFFA